MGILVIYMRQLGMISWRLDTLPLVIVHPTVHYDAGQKSEGCVWADRIAQSIYHYAEHGTNAVY